MRPTAALFALLPLLMLGSQASALTAEEKAETCKFGAEHQKVPAAKMKAFMARCMSDKNDPRPAAKKTAGKKAATTKMAPAAAPDADKK